MIASHPPTLPPVPTRVGRYEVLLPIASGGMATVYLARTQGARGFARDVALKLTHGHLINDSSEFAAILLEEARIASRIKHRNVVSILDLGEDPLGLYLVMDYVEGDTLGGLQRSAMARGEPIPWRIGIRVLLDALAGLHAAHDLCDAQGRPMAVVHRDFSPQNILVGLDGIAQLADFGIAKAADSGGETATGIVKGKVAYMSPEHARSQRIDRRADVWSAGVVAWEILARRRLHSSKEGGLATLLKVVSETPPLLGTIVQGIPARVEEVVARALEPNLELRYSSAASLAQELADAFGLTSRVADHEEVANYVRLLAGPKLEKRRSQVEDALNLRVKMAELAEASVNAGGSITDDSSNPQRAQMGLANQPSPPSALLDVDIHVDLDPTVSDPSDASTLPLASTPTIVTETSSTSDAVGRSATPAWLARRPSPAWLVGGLAFAIAAGGALVALGRGSGHAGANIEVATGGTASKPASSSEVAIPAPMALGAAVTPAVVRVHANVKVASLRINSRVAAVAPPATDVSFERRDEEKDAALTVVVTTVDGRRRTLTIAPDAESLTAEFPVVRAAAGTPGGPASARAGQGSEIPPNPFAHPGLAPDPFGR